MRVKWQMKRKTFIHSLAWGSSYFKFYQLIYAIFSFTLQFWPLFFNQLSNLNTTEPENYSKRGPIAAILNKRPTQNFTNNQTAVL